MLVCKDADNTVRWKPGERLNHYFEQRCDQLPADHLAVITEDVTLTFRELDDRANQAARYLLDQGLKPGDRIALLFDKSIHSYVALLAVLKIGAAYVPLDAGFPNDRIAFILEDAEVKAIALGLVDTAKKLAEFQPKQIFLDQASAEIAAKSDCAPDRDGSAAIGRPALLHHLHLGHDRQAEGRRDRSRRHLQLRQGRRRGLRHRRSTTAAYQGMTLAFDFHVEDLVGAADRRRDADLAAKSGTSLFGADLHAFLQKNRVTVFPCVPTFGRRSSRICRTSASSSSPASPFRIISSCAGIRPGRRILNAYGPTECSVSSTLRLLVPDRPVTIGIPLPTYTVVILDENKDEVVPDGAIGEIGIAGVALARGYLNREELTRQEVHPRLPQHPEQSFEAHLSHRRSRPHPRGRRARFPRPHRHAGEDPRLPHRARRDRGGADAGAADRAGGRQPLRAGAGRGRTRRLLHPQAGRARDFAQARSRRCCAASCRATWCRAISKSSPSSR